MFVYGPAPRFPICWLNRKSTVPADCPVIKPLPNCGNSLNPLGAGTSFFASSLYWGLSQGVVMFVPVTRYPKRASLTRLGDNVDVKFTVQTDGRRNVRPWVVFGQSIK